jgi:NADH-quinone oxidoreductase subunit J
LSELFNPILLYGGCALGALGVAIALPRRGLSPQLIGALIAAIGLGGIFLAVGLRAAAVPGGMPNFMFYIFAVIALGASLRVISHPRPVYAALYFILTILASAGLYLILAAEFMAFALIIVYAGAILITYLFVIMLATESPTEDDVEALRDYDRYSREPIAATVVGFVLVAMLATMLGRGSAALSTPPAYSDTALLAEMPGRIQRALRDAELLLPGETVRIAESGDAMIDVAARTAVVGVEGQVDRVVSIPASLSLSNTEGVAFDLIAGHPGAIEIAGVILLMAMLGAVVLSRKRAEIDEAGPGDRPAMAAAHVGTGGNGLATGPRAGAPRTPEGARA